MKMYVEVDNKLKTGSSESKDKTKDSKDNNDKKSSTFAESHGLSSNARILMEGC